MAGYYEAVSMAQRSGRTGQVVPTQAGPGGQISYEFRPSGLQTSGPYAGGGGGGISNLYGSIAAQSEAARKANEARYGEAKNIYEQIIQLYSPGGEFGKGFEAQLGRAKTQSVAQGAQALVSSGLYGTTQTAGLGKKFEEEVGVPARLQMEDVRMGKYAGAMQAKAGVIERREDEYPDYNMIAQLVRQIAGGR